MDAAVAALLGSQDTVLDTLEEDMPASAPAPATPPANTSVGEHSPIPAGQKSPKKPQKPKASPKKPARKAKAAPKHAAVKAKAKAVAQKPAAAAGKAKAAAALKKRPAAATEEVPPKKKPAGGSCFHGLTGKYSDSPAAGDIGAEEEEEDEGVEDPEIELEEEDEENADAEEGKEDTLDRSKKAKFRQYLMSNMLPKEVVETWSRLQAMKRGKRQHERDLINGLFKRDSKGSLVPAFKNNVIENKKDLCVHFAVTCVLHNYMCSTCTQDNKILTWLLVHFV